MLVPEIGRAPPRPPGDAVVSIGGRTMGTTWSARYVAPPGLAQARAQATLQAELDAVVALFSPWEADSEVTRFNTAPPGPVVLSPAFRLLLAEALDIADDTDGAVSPTLGALVDLWGFGPPGPRATPPAEAEIETARAASDWRAFRLNRDTGEAIQPGGLRLDFSALAKGHAVDRLSDRLTALGASSHLVEIGGELKGAGVKPDGQPWWVEIERPPEPTATLPTTVCALYDLAVATSGDYHRAFAHGGRLYPHTIDGGSGRPIDNGLASVTVIDASALRADALSTALTVMGPHEGFDYACDLALAAMFVERTPRGLSERPTPALLAMMDDDAPAGRA